MQKTVLFLVVLSMISTTNFVYEININPNSSSLWAQESSSNGLDEIQKLVSDSQFEEAIEKLKILIKNNPRNSRYHYELGTIYQKKGSLDDALYEFDLSERLALGEKIDINIKKSEGSTAKPTDIDNKSITKVEKETSLTNSDNNSKRMFAGAYGYYIQGKYDDAIEKYLSALKIDPNNAQGCFELGQVYQDIGDTQNAIKFYEKAISINPDFITPYKKLAFLKATSGDIQKAITLYEKLISTDPKDSKVFYALSKLYRENNQLEKSYNAMLSAYNIDSTNPKIFNDLKTLSLELGKPLKTSVNKEVNNIDSPENLDALLSKANTYLKNKDLDNSVESFKKVLLIDPNNSKAKLGLSLAMSSMAANFLDKGYPEYSERMFLKSLEYDPSNLKSIERLANLYKQSKDNQKAEKYFKMYLEKGFDKNIAYNLAILYKDTGDIKSYIAYLEEIYKIDNKFKDVCEKLANYYLSSDNREKALTYLIKSFDNSKSYNTAKEIANIYYKMGDLNTSKQYYEKVLSIKNNDFDSLKNKGMIELYLNASSEALSDLNRAVSINNKDAQLFFEIAKIYQEKKDLLNALKNYNTAVQIDPNLSQAYYLAGLIYKNQNQNNLAKEYLIKVSLLDPNNPDVKLLLAELETKKDTTITKTSEIKKDTNDNKIVFAKDESSGAIKEDNNPSKQSHIPSYIQETPKDSPPVEKVMVKNIDTPDKVSINDIKTDLPRLQVTEKKLQDTNQSVLTSKVLIKEPMQEENILSYNKKEPQLQLKSEVKVTTIQPLQNKSIDNHDEDHIPKLKAPIIVNNNTKININDNKTEANEEYKDNNSSSIPIFIADDEDYSEWSHNNATYNKNKVVKDNDLRINNINDAENALKNGNFLQTIDIISELIENNPSEKAYYLLGKAYYQKSDYSKAVDNLRRAVSLNSNNGEYKILLAKALIKENYPLEALKILTNLPSEKADNSEITSLIGDIYYSQSKYSEALVYYNRLISASPLTNENVVKMSNLYNKLGQYNNSVELLVKSISSGFKSYDIYYNLVVAYKNLKNIDKAELYLSKAEELEPNNPNNDILSSEIRQLTNVKPDYASKYKQNSNNSEITSSGSMYEKANTDFQNGNLAEAIEKYEEIIKTDSNSIDAFYNLGTAYKKLGKYDEAIYNYKQALKLNPKDKDILVNLGTTYIEAGDYSRASNTLYNAIQYDPNNATNYSLLGITYFKKGFYEDALKSFVTATELKGNSLSNFYNIGMCYIKLKDKKMAETFFQKAFNLRAVTMEDYMVLASIYKELSQYGKAKSIYNKVIKENPFSILPRYKLIQLYELTANYNDMGKEIQNLLKIDPDSKLANLARQKLQHLNRNN